VGCGTPKVIGNDILVHEGIVNAITLYIQWG